MSFFKQKLQRLGNKTDLNFSKTKSIDLSGNLYDNNFNSKENFFQTLSELKKDFLLNKPDKNLTLNNFNEYLYPINSSDEISDLYLKMEEKAKKKPTVSKNYINKTEEIKNALIHKNNTPIKDDNKNYYNSSVLNKLKNEFHLDWNNRSYSKNFFSTAKREKIKDRKIKNFQLNYDINNSQKKYDKFVNDCLDTIKNSKYKSNNNEGIENIKKLTQQFEKHIRNKSDGNLDKVDIFFHITNNNKRYNDNKDFNKFKKSFKPISKVFL